MEINYDYVISQLKNKLGYQVQFEEDNYIFTNDLLDITVWGNTRDEAEQAFSFALSALYQNYAIESDDKLTQEAKAIKAKLLELERE